MPIRVLKIIHTLGHGGAENIFRWLAWQLKGDRQAGKTFAGPACSLCSDHNWDVEPKHLTW